MAKTLLLLLLAALLAGCAPAGDALPPETTAETTPQITAETAMDTTAAPTEAEPQRYVLTFAGDCTLGSNPHNWYAGYGFPKTVGEDWAYPFANVIDYFRADDLTLVNLEGTFCDSGSPVPKAHNFRGPCSYVSILTENSVEAVTIANNHSYDYGPGGYASTTATLESAGIPFVEDNSTTLLTLEGGLTVGLYGTVYYSLDQDHMTASIQALKDAGAELIVVLPHWGAEYVYQPGDTQIDFGRAAIDAGADIVCGSHPHVLQPIEDYGSGVILYSLGNFSFAGNLYPADYDTALVQQEVLRHADGTVTLGRRTVIPCSLSSVEDHNNFQPTPYPAESDGYARVLKKLGLA